MNECVVLSAECGVKGGPFPIPHSSYAAPVMERKCGRNGFTLVEILAAVVILSIGCLALLAAIPVARESQQRAVNMAIARNIGQSKIDWLRSSAYDTISGYGDTQNDASLPKGYWTIQANAVDNNLCVAVVTVGWTEAHGGDRKVYEARTLSYTTFIVRS